MSSDQLIKSLSVHGAAAGIKMETGESAVDFQNRIMSTIQKASSDAWDKLPEETQKWYNAIATAEKKKKETEGKTSKAASKKSAAAKTKTPKAVVKAKEAAKKKAAEVKKTKTAVSNYNVPKEGSALRLVYDAVKESGKSGVTISEIAKIVSKKKGFKESKDKDPEIFVKNKLGAMIQREDPRSKLNLSCYGILTVSGDKYHAVSDGELEKLRKK